MGRTKDEGRGQRQNCQSPDPGSSFGLQTSNFTQQICPECFRAAGGWQLLDSDCRPPESFYPLAWQVRSTRWKEKVKAREIRQSLAASSYCFKLEAIVPLTQSNAIAPPADFKPDQRLWPVATVMATGIFATTFVQLQGLGYLPFNHLLQKVMGLNSDQAATFFSLSMLPWTFKIIAGLLVDGVPLFGSRRRGYLLLSALTAAGMWLLMGISPDAWLRMGLSTKNYFNMVLALAIGMNTAIVFGSTTSGGLLVEAGQRFGVSGRLSSLRVFAQNLGAGLGLPLGGLLAAKAMGWTSAAAALPLMCMFFSAWFLLKEPPLPARVEHGRSFIEQHLHVIASIWAQIKNVLRREMLLPALLMFFIQFVPTFRSTCFYRISDQNTELQRRGAGLAGAGGLRRGVVEFGRLCLVVPQGLAAHVAVWRDHS